MNHRLVTACALFALAATPAWAECSRELVSYNFPAQRLDEALQALTERTGCVIEADTALVGERQAPTLAGTYRPEEALWALLKASGLEGYPTDEGLEVSQREQAWVREHTEALRARLASRPELDEAKRDAYLYELDELERSVQELARQQGFISAAERASYQRSIEEVTRQLEKAQDADSDARKPLNRAAP
ncbi:MULTISPECIES: hypothetical protein [unclassified Halomonas]|uniref:hypothetical protein n=1 Tax=unclassified Halomonas TaxID=2609666 RepID=UPI00209FF547|nr:MULTISPECIES: hypothetical protein [unclassified Halomonas]MCP1314403.1 hypothetical protein [Halomonas sp. 707D7]MCP1325909.1 hypothetical protein [Halomonas sp. 707D4]